MTGKRARLEPLASEAGGDWLTVATRAHALVLAAWVGSVLAIGTGGGHGVAGGCSGEDRWPSDGART
jgi:hypothetical protein